MTNTLADILERIARIEATLGGPVRDDDPELGADQPLEDESQDRRLSTALVAKRYGVVVRTIERWLERPDLNFPLPDVVNGRRYWWLSRLRNWDRQRLRQSIQAG